ncbi:hypothetical protein PQI07_26425 [Methylobacterium sp. 092160098-2]|uniref:hypothetical protein n=1 Tax=Methylobacterium sp. 092160098-2 TaxID=3025129 RepID=UPI002381ABE0|nr:hypothetical protein [Methylobacterium sp. 092160098-2]MDE4914210.1 hypothetical protein [Methylobacterium sp. 092160098-2]
MTGGTAPAASPERWFIGTSTRSRDATAMIAIKGERGADGSAAAIDDPQKLFPNNGEVELRGHAALALKTGDWLLVRTARNDRHRSQASFKAVGHRRLAAFADLSRLGSAEAARRLLVEDGWGDGSAGEWAFRVDAEHVVRLSLASNGQGLFKAAGPGIEALAACRFDPARVVDFAAADDVARYYDVTEQEQISTYDWSDDATYIDRIVRALADGDASDNTPLRIARWLRDHADALADISDSGVAQEILRSRALANRLSARRDLLDKYFSAVRSDPEIYALVARAAEEAAAAEVPEIRARLEADLAEEVRAGRDEKEAEVRRSLAQLERDLLEDLDRTIEAKSAQADAEIAERKRTADAAVDAGLSERRVALEQAVARLDGRLAAGERDLAAATADLERRRSDIEALGTVEAEARDRAERSLAAAEAAAREAAAREETAREQAAHAAAAGGRSDAATVQRAVAALPTRFAAGGELLSGKAFTEAVRGSGLLSEKGRTALLQAVVLMLAGEVPIIHGDEAADLVEVAESLLSGGRTARLQADPTVISIEDLWTRPGASVPTPLREAVAYSSSDDGGTVLGVIADADRSALRFWHPAVAAAARRGDLPRRLLLCCTVAKVDAEEVEALGRDACLVDAEGSIAPGASAAAALLLGPASPKLSALDPTDPPADMKATVSSVSKVGFPTRIAHARRLARICAEAIALEMDAGEVESLLSRLRAAWEGRPEAAPTIKLVTSNN